MNDHTTRFGLALEYFLNVDHVPIVTALERGCFERRGLDVQLVQPVNLDAGLQLVAERALDLAITAPIHMPAARAAGLPIVAVGRYLETGYGVMVRAGLGLAGLRGRAITAGWTWAAALDRASAGASGPLGTYAPTLFQAMAESQGVRLEEDDVEFVPVPYYLDAIVSGRADAAFGVFENYEVEEARLAGVDMEMFRFPECGVPSFGHLAFVANEHAWEDATHRARIKTFLDAIAEGVDLTLQDPDSALDALSNYVPHLDVDKARALYPPTLECYRTDLALDASEWEALASFANSHGLARRDVTGSEMIRSLPAL